MAWDKQSKKFLWVAVAAAIALAVYLVVGNEGFITSAGQGIIDWACGLMGVDAPQIF